MRGDVADQSGDLWGLRSDRDRRDLDLGLAQQHLGVPALLRQHHGDDVAGAARTCRAARTVQVSLVLCWRIDVDDQFDVIHVHTASGDVRGDEHAGASTTERCEVAIALRLGQVAVQVDGGDPLLRQLLGVALRLVLRACEEDAAAHAGGQLSDEVLLVVVRHLEDVVGHRGDVGFRFVDRVQNLVVEEAADQLVHTVVERGGEEHPLTVGRGLLHDPRDTGEEAQVSHVVGLVEDRDLHGVERERALLEQVLEAAGAGHDDVDAAPQSGDLLVGAHAAEDGGGAHAVDLCERCDDRVDLGRELAGRGEDQAARTLWQVRGIPLGAQAGDHRDGEGERLA